MSYLRRQRLTLSDIAEDWEHCREMVRAFAAGRSLLFDDMFVISAARMCSVVNA